MISWLWHVIIAGLWLTGPYLCLALVISIAALTETGIRWAVRRRQDSRIGR
jgi:hypothetical protein